MKAFLQREWQFILLAVLTVVAYSLFFGYGYISWDDPEMVFRNADVQHFSIRHFFTNFYVGNYLPLTMLAHSIAWQLFGDSAGLHHAVSLLLHIINAWLVLKLSRQLFGSSVISITATAVFLLHPVQLESVGWISEFKTVLYTFFFLQALLKFLQYGEDKKLITLLLSLLLFAAALLSKPAAVTFPVLALLIAVIKRPKEITSLLVSLSPFILLAGVFSYVNIVAQTQAQLINQAHAFAYWQRFLFAGFALLKYAGNVIAPLRLSVVYAYPAAEALVFASAALVWLVLLVVLTFSIRKKWYLVIIAIGMLFVNLLPVLQFIPFGEALYADRYLYLPLLGFGWLLGLAFEKLKLPVNYSVLPLALVLCLLSFQRSRVWHSALELYENVLRNNPTSFVALNSAGVECMLQNQDRKANAYFTTAITNNTRNYKGFYNRGLLLLKVGKPADAIKDFNACLALHDYAKANAGRAAAYFQLHDLSKAKQDAEYALSIDAEQGKALFILAECYNDMNQVETAIAFYNKAIAVSGSDPDYFFKRAIAYGKLQNFSACVSDLEVVLKLDANYYEAYYWRGVAKINLHQNACADFETAAKHQIQPAITAYYKYCQ